MGSLIYWGLFCKVWAKTFSFLSIFSKNHICISSKCIVCILQNVNKWHYFKLLWGNQCQKYIYKKHHEAEFNSVLFFILRFLRIKEAKRKKYLHKKQKQKGIFHIWRLLCSIFYFASAGGRNLENYRRSILFFSSKIK